MASDRNHPPSALLLLPVPSSFAFDRVKDAFEPSVSDALKRLSEILKGSDRTAILDIALAIPDLLSPSNRPREKVFAPLQHYLSSIYTLVGTVAAARDIELDSPGGIDARVVFVDPTPPKNPTSSQTSPHASRLGPIVDLQTLASSGRPWNHVFFPDSQAGKDLVNSFTSSIIGPSKDRVVSIIQSVSGSSNWTVPQSLLVPAEQPTPTPHYSVLVGGTFDHLHLGHKLLLTATALALEPPDEDDSGPQRVVTVGVTGDALLAKKKYTECLESWEERFQYTAAFLAAIMDFSGDHDAAPRVQRSPAPAPNGQMIVVQQRPNLVFAFVEIFDTCGPATTDSSISALVLSHETQAGGAIVNEERAKKEWPALAIFAVDVLQSGEATDVGSFEAKISSTEIRRRRLASCNQ